LSDPRFDSEQDSRRKEVIEAARKAGINCFVQAGIGPEDWVRQEKLSSQYPGVLPVFGLHPYWVNDHSEAECEQALDLLAKKLATSFSRAIGEMGLDLRSQYKDTVMKQIEYFERQLELAQFVNRPVVLHLVRAHPEALKIFNMWGLPKAGGFVHSFTGSIEKANDFIALGLKISVGGGLCHPHNLALQAAVKEIPLDLLLLESDSPDQASPKFQGGLNEPLCILEVAKKIAELKGLDHLEVLDRTSQNARKLLAI